MHLPLKVAALKDAALLKVANKKSVISPKVQPLMSLGKHTQANMKCRAFS